VEDEDIDGKIIKPDKEILRKNKNMFDNLICTFYNDRLLIDRTLKKLTESEELNIIKDIILDV